MLDQAQTKIARRSRIAIVSLMTLTSLSCEDISSTDALLSPSEPGDFHLYVSNQSYQFSPVDVIVYLDGKLAVNQLFYVKAQHTWVRFNYDLGNGTHALRAISRSAGLDVERSVVLPDSNWCVIEFWYNPQYQGGQPPKTRDFSFYFYSTEPFFI